MGFDIYMFSFVIATLCGFAILAYLGDVIMKKIEQTDHLLDDKITSVKKYVIEKIKFGK